MDINNFKIEILNQSLTLALEWGENWLQPIQERIIAEYPNLSHTQADFLNSVCKHTMTDIEIFIYQTLSKERIDADILRVLLISYINEKYSWINESNSARLFSQGCYYAWKDGLL